MIKNLKQKLSLLAILYFSIFQVHTVEAKEICNKDNYHNYIFSIENTYNLIRNSKEEKGCQLEGITLDLSEYSNRSNQIILVNANLKGVEITGLNLSGANLTGADLSNVNLSWMNLTKANLSNTTLTDTNFKNANLTDATFFGAYLSGTILSKADISGAKFNGANFSFVAVIDTKYNRFTVFPTRYKPKKYIMRYLN